MDLGNGLPAILPSAGAISVVISLVVWLIRRGDSNLRSDIVELRKQRDEALDGRDRAEAALQGMRDRTNRAETELVMYRRAFGLLDEDTLMDDGR